MSEVMSQDFYVCVYMMLIACGEKGKVVILTTLFDKTHFGHFFRAKSGLGLDVNESGKRKSIVLLLIKTESSSMIAEACESVYVDIKM